MAIELNGVSKRYKNLNALENVNVKFGSSKIYGLLGSNGAGKSTLLNIITNRIFANSGTVMIDGENACSSKALSKVFMVGEANYYPEDIHVNKAFEATALFQNEFDMGKAVGLAEKFGLDIKKKISALSTGYASIFRLVTALSVRTPYLIFDEPVLGLDAQHRDMFYRILMEDYIEEPRTIIISTHLIQEVAGLVEHVVIIKKGHVIRDAATDELLTGAYNITGPVSEVDSYTNGKSVISQYTVGGLKTVCVKGKAENIPNGLEVTNMNLQDYFISLMNSDKE